VYAVLYRRDGNCSLSNMTEWLGIGRKRTSVGTAEMEYVQVRETSILDGGRIRPGLNRRSMFTDVRTLYFSFIVNRYSCNQFCGLGFSGS
jgi:DNA-binding transcriptional regulator GbsR (MarR family)